MGRPPVSETIVALVRAIAHGEPELTHSGLVKRCLAAGVQISRPTVTRIVSRTHRDPWASTGRKKPNEKTLDKPQRCPGCGGKTTVLPCRVCSALADLEANRQRRAAVTELERLSGDRVAARYASSDDYPDNSRSIAL
jgi:hypothetical protein